MTVHRTSSLKAHTRTGCEPAGCVIDGEACADCEEGLPDYWLTGLTSGAAACSSLSVGRANSGWRRIISDLSTAN
jgi:hypothetical protein